MRLTPQILLAWNGTVFCPSFVVIWDYLSQMENKHSDNQQHPDSVTVAEWNPTALVLEPNHSWLDRAKKACTQNPILQNMIQGLWPDQI